MAKPFASGLFEITSTGLIGILFFLTAFKIFSILLPLPEIKMTRFSMNWFYCCMNKHFTNLIIPKIEFNPLHHVLHLINLAIYIQSYGHKSQIGFKEIGRASCRKRV